MDSAGAMGFSTPWEDPASSGALLSSSQTMLGDFTCRTSMAILLGLSTVKMLVILSVASGINLFDSFDNLIIFREAVEFF